ncbi:alpha/beta fold hydrolase [Saccharothrix yanglingensis]|uniref:Alpha/beta hydrolase n=1 Tax=Saccharothrix yanglingensis TaxID=659496 RepID=A0ABU0WWL2_9PSEU|nr:alpha/beta hydrolase [Saccharothrix yanglingensis]MDQ2584250.1 alpha/beta hydrolase [Saccharothrix yanglingensis]
MTTLDHWGGTSRYADLDGPVHYVDFGGDGPPVVLVHGLGGSHLNWCLLAPHLVGRHRVLAVDLAGFGLTHPEGRSTTVPSNARLLDRFVADVVGEPVALVGNSMGGMISVLHAARRPAGVTHLALLDPAVPLLGARLDPQVAAAFALYSLPGAGRWLLERSRRGVSPRRQVKRVLNLVCANSKVVPEEVVLASMNLIEQREEIPGLDEAFLAAARSVVRASAAGRRYYAAMSRVKAPVYLAHGDRDRLVPVKAAEAAARRNPSWEFEVFEGVGHVPQLEIPEVIAERLLTLTAR